MSQFDWESLLSLHGVTFVVDESLGFWVKFEACEATVSTGVPHGVRYSLTFTAEVEPGCWGLIMPIR